MRRALCVLLTSLLCSCMALYEPPWSPYPPPPQTGAVPPDCEAQADRNQPITQGIQGTAIGATAGAALGAAIGGFAFGAIGAAAGWGALAGGIAGADVGALHGQQAQQAEYQACVAQHGASPTQPSQQ
jgi:hypothetical protein